MKIAKTKIQSKKLQWYQNVQNFEPNNIAFMLNYEKSNGLVTKCKKPDNELSLVYFQLIFNKFAYLVFTLAFNIFFAFIFNRINNNFSFNFNSFLNTTQFFLVEMSSLTCGKFKTISLTGSNRLDFGGFN